MSDINLCIGALWAPVYLFLLPGRDPQPGKSFFARMAEVDWIGNILVAGAFVSGIMAISFGGVVYSVGPLTHPSLSMLRLLTAVSTSGARVESSVFSAPASPSLLSSPSNKVSF